MPIVAYFVFVIRSVRRYQPWGSDVSPMPEVKRPRTSVGRLATIRKQRTKSPPSSSYTDSEKLPEDSYVPILAYPKHLNYMSVLQTTALISTDVSWLMRLVWLNWMASGTSTEEHERKVVSVTQDKPAVDTKRENSPRHPSTTSPQTRRRGMPRDKTKYSSSIDDTKCGSTDRPTESSASCSGKEHAELFS